MTSLFAYVLEMSVSAAFAALAVLIFRFILKKAPKWIVCALWGLVAIKLIIPFSFQTPLSFSPPQKEQVRIQIRENLVSEEDGSFWTEFAAENGLQANESTELKSRPASQKTDAKQTPSFSFRTMLPYFWLTGVAAMLTVMIASYVRLKLLMRTSVPHSKGIRQSEMVQSPFILGFSKPVIYLPFGLDDWTVLSVLAHEKAHIKRGDHLFKPLAWILLSLHWFNPLLWLSYALFCKDVESACDEKVLADMTEEERRDYARALLKCSTRSVGVYACPLAFGEQNVKGRIKMTLYYKKPVFWIIVLSLIIATIATIGILSDPILKADKKSDEENRNAVSAIQTNADQTAWWGAMEDFEIKSNGQTTIFNFSYDQAVFQEKAINKNDQRWSDPVMVAESMTELTDILKGCTRDGEQNKYLLQALDSYFEKKKTEYNKIYPASNAPDFFEDHVIMMVFARPQDTCWYVEQARLKETKDNKLQVILDIANFFPNNGSMPDGSGSLKFYWISKETWSKHKNGTIEIYATRNNQPDWISYENYLWKNGDTGEIYYLILRKNPYDKNPLSCSVNFGGTYLTKSKWRFLDYYVNLGYENDSTLRGQAENCTFYYSAEKEDGVLTVHQCSYKRGEEADILATHSFKIEPGKLIYDASSSPVKIEGLPDGAVFTINQPNF